MFSKEMTKMDRRQFAYKAGRWGLALTLAGITASLARKIVFKKDCRSCPDYATCTMVEKCKTPPEQQENE